jgi:GNAT superfamily N-acetyltransferase
MMHSYFREACQAANYNAKWDEERAVIHLGNLLWKETGLNFIAENAEGMILGELGETWFGPNPLAKPHILYVKPEHRNGLIARALLRRFEKEAVSRKVDFILWEFESGVSNGEVLGGLMENLGYKLQGPVYLKSFWG